MYLQRHAYSSMLSSCPLAIRRKSNSSHLCPKYASETIFFGGAPNANFPTLQGGTPTWSLRSLTVFLADYFRRHGNKANFQRRSLVSLTALIMMMNVSEMACLMLVLFRHIIVYIIVPYHVQTLPRAVILFPHILLSETLKYR